MIRLTPRQRHPVFSLLACLGDYWIPFTLLSIAFATLVVMFVIWASSPSGLVAAHGRIEEKQRTGAAA
jgi:hypothetical protein